MGGSRTLGVRLQAWAPALQSKINTGTNACSTSPYWTVMFTEFEDAVPDFRTTGTVPVTPGGTVTAV